MKDVARLVLYLIFAVLASASNAEAACCRVCNIGKACGNSCINSQLTCHQPPGCACNRGESPERPARPNKHKLSFQTSGAIDVREKMLDIVPSYSCAYVDIDPVDDTWSPIGTWESGRFLKNGRFLSKNRELRNLKTLKREYPHKQTLRSAYSKLIKTRAVHNAICQGLKLPHHLIFVSSVAYSGDLGGLRGADDKCQTLASKANLPGKYAAILSDATVFARTRININRPVRNISDQYFTGIVALDEDQFWSGRLENPVRCDEYGRAPISGGYAVWTATYFTQTLPVELRSDGMNSCSDWTSSSSSLSALVGYSEDQGLNFLHWHPTSWVSACSDMRKLYCISG